MTDTNKTSIEAVVTYRNSSGKIIKQTKTTHEASDLQAEVRITIHEHPPIFGGTVNNPGATSA